MSIELIGDGQAITLNHIGLYSDNTPMVKLSDFDPKNIHTMVLQHSSTTQFVAAMFLIDSIAGLGGKVETLVLPYMPGARQDRINITGDILFSAFSFADMIKTREFDRVVILDPHSPVVSHLLGNVDEYPLSDIANRIWKGYTGIIAPDKGAKARAEIFARALGKPIYYASKTRDVSTGALSGFEIDIPFGHYLVVDDICDGGGTFVGLGEKIMEQGAFADLYVTHGIFAKGIHELKRYYKNIYTTDSLPLVPPGVMTIPVLERMKNYE